MFTMPELFLVFWLCCYTISICNSHTIYCDTYRKCLNDVTLACIDDGSDCTLYCGPTGNKGCDSAVFNCGNGRGCTVICQNFEACKNITINANDATFLNVESRFHADAAGQNELMDATINCGTTPLCNVQCTDRFRSCYNTNINAESAGRLNVTCAVGNVNEHCSYSTIKCPKSTPACYIYADDSMFSMSIYSQLGFNGVEICASAPTQSIGTLYCQSGYTQSCVVDATDPNVCQTTNTCDSDGGAVMTCTDNPILQTPAPTIDPTPVPTANTTPPPTSTPTKTPTLTIIISSYSSTYSVDTVYVKVDNDRIARIALIFVAVVIVLFLLIAVLFIRIKKLGQSVADNIEMDVKKMKKMEKIASFSSENQNDDIDVSPPMVIPVIVSEEGCIGKQYKNNEGGIDDIIDIVNQGFVDDEIVNAVNKTNEDFIIDGNVIVTGRESVASSHNQINVK